MSGVSRIRFVTLVPAYASDYRGCALGGSSVVCSDAATDVPKR